MRHRLSRRGLGRKSSHRQALIRNQITELLRHDRIVTTEAKAKSVRPEAEKVITLGKRGTLHARRRAGAVLTDTAILTKLFDEIAPRFETRPGGYTRITKLGPRQGDGARMAMLELVVGSAVAGPTTAGAAAVAEPEAAVEDEQEDAVDETAEDETAADDATDDATDGGADDEAESDEPSAELSADEADASDDATDDSTDDAETDEEES
jgi:large subunit ribosomal protein L17